MDPAKAKSLPANAPLNKNVEAEQQFLYKIKSDAENRSLLQTPMNPSYIRMGSKGMKTIFNIGIVTSWFTLFQSGKTIFAGKRVN